MKLKILGGIDRENHKALVTIYVEDASAYVLDELQKQLQELEQAAVVEDETAAATS